MAAFKYLFVKEVRQFMGTRIMPIVSIMLPLVSMLLMPLVATMEVKDVNLCIVDHDRSSLSTRLTNQIISSDYFIFTSQEETYQEALDQLGLGKCDIILEIPEGMERDLMRGETVDVYIAANAVNSTKGSMGSGYLSNIIADFATELQSNNAVLTASPMSLEVQYRYNPHMSYRRFMVPALMIMVLVMLCGFLPTLSIVMEKENGTIEQINVSPVSKLQFILTKVLTFGLAGMFSFILSFSIGRFVYGVGAYGGYPEILVGAILFLLFMAGLGMIISNISSTILQSMFTMMFFVLILMLMSGIFTSVSSMATWAQYITYVLPTRYFVGLMRSVCLKGSHFADLRLEYCALAIAAVAINAIAIITYRKQS